MKRKPRSRAVQGAALLRLTAQPFPPGPLSENGYRLTGLINERMDLLRQQTGRMDGQEWIFCDVFRKCYCFRCRVISVFICCFIRARIFILNKKTPGYTGVFYLNVKMQYQL